MRTGCPTTNISPAQCFFLFRRRHVTISGPMAGLLALVCALHVLGGVARAGVVGGQKKLDLFQNTNSLNGGGCGQCDLDKMVKDCPLDVMFMLDMSDSVSPVDYQQAQNYVARQITSVADAFQGTQVGFLAFSNIVHTDIPLQPRSSQELVQVANTVRSLPQQRYGTKLAGALRHARESLAAHNGTALVPGGRRGKLIVLVSDGCPDDDRTVKKEAVQAELDGMAIVSVTLDDEFMGLLRSISLQVLELRTDIDWRSVVACPVCGDFVVAMDGSDSVRRWEKVMRDYLAFTAMLYDNQYNAMGVVVFGTNATSQSSDTMIKPIRDKLELVEQIEKKLSFPNERGTGTTQAIREATAFLRELAQTGSSALSRSLVIITDGPALHPQNARQALADARAEGFQVVVIGVGDAVTAQELQVMAGQQSVVVRVDSYLKLFALKLSDYICQNGGRPGCTTPCPAGKIQDPNTCTCSCPSDPQCNGLRTQDPSNCQCACRNSCLLGQYQDPFTCQCGCNVQCTPPQTLNLRTCQCQGCQKQCTYPQVLNQQTCQCGCQRQCTYPQVQNQQTCQCECQRQCTYPQVQNQQTCQCECQRQCPYPQVLNQKTCQCGCSQSVRCTSPQVLNSTTCQCECQRQCNYPQVLNQQTCQCECQKQCTYPQVLNQQTCQCECTKQCTYPQVLNQQTCQCECQKQCTYPQVLNQQTCQCVSGCQKQCTYPQGLNQLTCQCECKKQCSDPLDVNEQTCQCECQKQCTYPQVLNQQTCQCESKCTNTVNCAGNQKFNKQTYQCECTTSQNCNVGQFFNQFSCSCEWTTAPTWQPITTAPTWQPWTTAPTWQPRSTGSPATSKCSAANYRCQNNQPAVEDCQGRCICQCDRSLYAGFYCDLPIRASLCDNCTHINGHYLAGVEGRCDLYVVCQPTGNSAFLPHITQCPPGTIFKQDGRLGQALCDHPSSAASCPTDPCKNLPPYAKYSHSRTCNHYWQCDASGRTGASYCCPPGQGFDKTRGECIADANCPNDCDPNYKSCNGQGGKGGGGNVVTCPLKAAQDDPRKFYHIFGPKGLFQSCAPTDVFNDTLCLCMFNPNAGCAPTYDYNFDNLKEVTSGFLNVEIHPAASLGSSGNVAKFGGHSRIILYRFSASGYNIPYFEISLRVKLDNLNLVPGQEMAIVSNGDCGGEETLTISVDQQYVYFKVKTSQGSQPHIVKVPYGSSGGWLDIKFQYENKDSSKVYVMTGTVNGQSDSVTVIGVIGYTKCALQVGHGQGLQNLTGYVDDFKVWKCKPNGSNVNNRKGSNNQNGGSTTKNGGWNTRNGGFTTQNGGWNTRNGGSNTQNGGWNTRNGGSNTQNGGWNTRNGGSNTQNGWNTRNRGSRNTQNRGSWGSE
ncbi:hypothetical protein ACOMHN_056654 [Nucella lapillus]